MCYFVSLDCRASQLKYLNPLLNVVQLSDSTLLQFFSGCLFVVINFEVSVAFLICML